ncbi:MAG: hypothetical protein K8H86_09570, partial [Ignavibacteriaceae bacterium]|nr:hypothetical protein [Ignavibacteriaceae bacterium]
MFIKLFIFSIVILLISSCGSHPKKETVETTEEGLTISADSFYCYAKGIGIKKDSIVFSFDRIDFLHSDSAINAMVEDGLINKNENPPNDLYIRNKISLIETLPVDSTVKILMQTFSNDETGNFNWNEVITIGQFVKLLSKNSERNYINFPFFIKTENN